MTRRKYIRMGETGNIDHAGHPGQFELACLGEPGAGERDADIVEHLRWCARCRSAVADYRWLEGEIEAALSAAAAAAPLPRPKWWDVRGRVFAGQARRGAARRAPAVVSVALLICHMLLAVVLPLPQACKQRSLPQAYTQRSLPQAYTQRSLPQAYTQRSLPQAYTQRSLPQAYTQRSPARSSIAGTAVLARISPPQPSVAPPPVVAVVSYAPDAEVTPTPDMSLDGGGQATPIRTPAPMLLPRPEGKLQTPMGLQTAEPPASLQTAEPSASLQTAQPPASLQTAEPSADLQTAQPPILQE